MEAIIEMAMSTMTLCASTLTISCQLFVFPLVTRCAFILTLGVAGVSIYDVPYFLRSGASYPCEAESYQK